MLVVALLSFVDSLLIGLAMGGESLLVADLFVAISYSSARTFRRSNSKLSMDSKCTRVAFLSSVLYSALQNFVLSMVFFCSGLT